MAVTRVYLTAESEHRCRY